MGVVGKIRLAREDFNDRAWVCVSHDFDVLRNTRELAGKASLLVFDDVWSKVYNLEESLRSPFMVGAAGRLPLAATNVGYLCTKYVLSKIRRGCCSNNNKSSLCGLSPGENIRLALKSSYYHLPSHRKDVLLIVPSFQKIMNLNGKNLCFYGWQKVLFDK
ncbi:hypothetical protein JRO89_XS03G0333100 [Xanthoceras sorbifolium]|uniref:Uncharacterized protein n=1 Tax=Xanthoceras sorbifolium TaxID=99658 RepID=A0ABQ8IDQ9_9ROSI|nr:hypothetical protein JRO89_XS03G0333100 [Xanthoceras sorbifolium]